MFYLIVRHHLANEGYVQKHEYSQSLQVLIVIKPDTTCSLAVTISISYFDLYCISAL